MAGRMEHLLALFESDTRVLHDKSLLAPEAAVQPDENNCIM